jgi:hypothetical protein
MTAAAFVAPAYPQDGGTTAMTQATQTFDETRYSVAGGRMLSGMMLMFLLHAGAAAMLAFAAAAIVLMLNRETDHRRLFASVAAGIYAAAWAWGEHYCGNAQMRFLVPLWQIF